MHVIFMDHLSFIMSWIFTIQQICLAKKCYDKPSQNLCAEWEPRRKYEPVIETFSIA